MNTRSQARLLQSLLQVVEIGVPARLTCPKPRALCLRPILSFCSTTTHVRQFASSPPLKKKGKAPKDTPVPDNASQKGRDSEPDPYDYTELESGIAKAVDRLKEALTKTRSAGRISPETIENLPVQLTLKSEPGSSGQAKKESGRVGDYATVVPKGGRTMQVFVSEENVHSTNPSPENNLVILTPQVAPQTHLLRHPLVNTLLNPHTRRPERTCPEHPRATANSRVACAGRCGSQDDDGACVAGGADRPG